MTAIGRHPPSFNRIRYKSDLTHWLPYFLAFQSQHFKERRKKYAIQSMSWILTQESSWSLSLILCGIVAWAIFQIFVRGVPLILP